MKTEKEIEKVIERARQTDFHGKTFEEGVIDSLEWILGNYDDEPIAEEDLEIGIKLKKRGGMNNECKRID